MVINNKNSMIYTITECFKLLDEYFISSQQFKRSGRTWFKESQNVTKLINFQSSKITNNFYLNIGLYFNEYENSQLNSVSDIPSWHFSARYNLLIKYLNPEMENVDSRNVNLIKDIESIPSSMSHYIIPFLNQISKYDYLVDNFHTSHLFLSNIIWVHADQKDIFNFFKTFNKNVDDSKSDNTQ